MVSKGAIDDADPGGIGCSVAEVATRQAWDPHGFEITRSCHIQLHGWIGVVGLRIFRMETVAAISAGQRGAVSRGNRKDAWNRGHPLTQLFEELSSALGRVAVDPRVDREHQEIVGAEANVDADCLFEAAQE